MNWFQKHPDVLTWPVILQQWLKQERRVVLTSGGITLLILLLRLSGLLQLWELVAFDRLFHLHPTEPVDERLLIVEVDEETLTQAGSWPLSDRLMAQLLRQINNSQPLAIGLDIYRDLPVPPGHEEFLASARTIPNLIGIEKLEDQFYSGTPPSSILKTQDQVGFNNVPVDFDGKVRRLPLYWHVDGKAHNSFALKLALLYLEQQGVTPQRATINSDYLQLGQAVFRPFQANDGGYIGADAGAYQVLANFRSVSSFKRVKMQEVLAGTVQPALIHGKIVVIGTTAPSLKDQFYIPYNNRLHNSNEPVSGVELQANFVSQILSAALQGRSLIQVWPEGIEWLWIFGWSLVGALVISQAQSPRRMLAGIVLTGGILGGINSLAFLWGWWLPFIPPMLGLAGSAFVITSHIVYQQEELKRSKDFLQTIIDKIPEPVFVKDRQHHWIIVNRAFCQFSGYPRQKLLGKSEEDVFPTTEAEIFRHQDNLIFATKQAHEDEAQFTDAFNNTHLIVTKRSLHQDAAGNIFLVGVIRDITERKRIEAQLRQLALDLSRDNAELKRSATRLQHDAYHDDLTGLANRKLFHQSLSQSLEWAQINHQLVGLLFIDLDGFKQINDNLGHDLGDMLLKIVAKRLSNELRSSDIVSRLGGDEFTVILPGIKKAEYTARVAQKLLDTLSQPLSLQGHTAQVTGSIGISVYPKDGEVIEELVKQADSAMYNAKKLGRNQYQFFQQPEPNS